MYTVWKGCLGPIEPSRTRVALLIDGDNSASVSITSLLAEAGKLGDVMIRRVYGKQPLQDVALTALLIKAYTQAAEKLL